MPSQWRVDWINKTIKKKRVKQRSLIWLNSEIHKDYNDLIPFILETKDDPRTKRLGNYSWPELSNHNQDSVPLKDNLQCRYFFPIFSSIKRPASRETFEKKKYLAIKIWSQPTKGNANYVICP